MHKKIKIISFLLLSFLLFQVEVQASDGATCAYEINSDVSMICSVSEVSSLTCSLYDGDTSIKNIKINDSKLPVSTFQKDEKWDCPKALYGTYSSLNGPSVKNLSANPGVNAIAPFQLLDSKSSYGTEIKHSGTSDSSSSSNTGDSTGTASSGKTSGCDILGGMDSKTVQLLSQVVKIVRLGIPILIIILGITDFMKILFSGEEKVFKEAFSRFLKRVLIGVIIIFTPYILQLLVSLSGIETQYGIDNFFCGIIDATGVKSDSVDKYKTRSDCEDKGYVWIPESTSPNGGFCSKVTKDASFYKNSVSCKSAGYIWNVQNSSCTTSKTISKEDCIASGYLYNANKQCVLSSGTTGENPNIYTNFISCNTAGYLWNQTSKKCMTNTEISQKDCTDSGYKVSSSSQGYRCIKRKASEHTTKANCEKFGYTWTYNDGDTGYCHT